jgi:dTDP-4-amino-4,6-dideoxygalactose transaminase
VGEEFPIDREGLLAALADKEISARRGIMAAHRQPAYADATHAPLPFTERLTDRTLILPVFHLMTDGDQDRVIKAVWAAAARSA